MTVTLNLSNDPYYFGVFYLLLFIVIYFLFIYSFNLFIFVWSECKFDKAKTIAIFAESCI